jgi:hypothetical protein
MALHQAVAHEVAAAAGTDLRRSPWSGVTVVAVRRSLPRLGHHMACISIDKKPVTGTKTAPR